MMRLSLTGTMVSRAMQRARWNAHSSLYSMSMVPTKRVTAASLGTTPNTSALRLLPPLRSSMGLLLCSSAQCFFGKVI
jgi:hypothetical protein